MDFIAALPALAYQPSFYQERRRIGKSEWQDLERTDMRQFCDFHSTEQQILANPELQEARGVHAGTH